MPRALFFLFFFILSNQIRAQQVNADKLNANRENTTINILRIGDFFVEFDQVGCVKQLYLADVTQVAVDKTSAFLYEPVHFHLVQSSDGKNSVLKPIGPSLLLKQGQRKWRREARNDSLSMLMRAETSASGKLRFKVSFSANKTISLKEITLHLPIIPARATKLAAFGQAIVPPPATSDLLWSSYNHPTAKIWLGDDLFGVELTLKKENWKNLPESGVKVAIKGSSFLINCFSGPLVLKKGEKRTFEFNLQPKRAVGF